MRILRTSVDIFDLPSGPDQAVIITTNGEVKKDGNAVMGKGIALQANELFNVSLELGNYLKKYGNHAFNLGLQRYNGISYHLLTFPTKNNWRFKSSLSLIERSCMEVRELIEQHEIGKVYMPPVGCGCGGLDWERDVCPLVKKLLPDNFWVVLR